MFPATGKPWSYLQLWKEVLRRRPERHDAVQAEGRVTDPGIARRVIVTDGRTVLVWYTALAEIDMAKSAP